MTARQPNPDPFFVVRQNQHDDHDIIAAVDADMVMHPSSIIADKIRVLLATPMLYEFMFLALYQEDAWACELAEPGERAGPGRGAKHLRVVARRRAYRGDA